MTRKAIYRAGTATLLVFLFAALLPAAVRGQSADQQTWATSITYYTPDAEGGTLQIRYYGEGSGTSIDADPITLSPHKAGSLFVGNVEGLPATFEGAAVLESDVPIVAAAVNIADSSFPRPLYSGFDAGAASENFFIPTILYQKFNTNSLVSIQNVQNTDINATLKVYEQGQQTPTFKQTYSLPPGSSELIPSTEMSLPQGFSGSAIVESDGKVVAAAQENEINGRGAKAFEGLAADAGSDTIYMASMMCEAFGGQTSYYAIQNVGTSPATVEIGLYDKAGKLVHSVNDVLVEPGDKASISPCDWVPEEPLLQGITGSAVFFCRDGTNLVVVGKVGGGGMTPTAFVGQSQGSTRVAAPYVRWQGEPTKGERSYIAIMNTGLEEARNISAVYYDGHGKRAGIEDVATPLDPLKPYTKANTDPSSAGALDDDGNFGVNPYGGAVEIWSDQPVAVVVRVSRVLPDGSGTVLAEDYNGTSLNGSSGALAGGGPKGTPPAYVPMVFKAGP